jgi:hypothetical protein
MTTKFIGAEFSVLANHGYSYSIIEGGWVSTDGATIVSETRSPYQRQIQQYKPDMQEAHDKNITALVNAGLAERGEVIAKEGNGK